MRQRFVEIVELASLFDAMGADDEELTSEIKGLVGDVVYTHEWLSWVLDGGVMYDDDT